MNYLANHRLTRYIAAALVAAILAGCGTTSQFSPGKGNKYRLSYKLVQPPAADDLFYQDGRVKVEFSLDEAAVAFRLQNTTNEPLSILWDRVSLGVDGTFQRVRHATDLYSDSLDGRPFTLPPLGNVRDLMIPWKNVREETTGWIEKDLLPTSDGGNPNTRRQIAGSKGKRVQVYMPVMFSDAVTEYEFLFEVSDVRQIRWRDYIPPKRDPAPPAKTSSPDSFDTITLALLSVGFLGLFAFLVTAEKGPVQE